MNVVEFPTAWPKDNLFIAVLKGSHAWVAGSSIAADGGLEWLLLAQLQP